MLPKHRHCIWTLPPGDTDYSTRWGIIKRCFSKQARKLFQRPEWINASKAKHRESTIWQRRFWEHEIRDQDDFNRHFDYIHWNPFKHGHVSRAVDWPYSTFHQYVAQDLYLANWGGDGIDRWIPDAFVDIRSVMVGMSTCPPYWADEQPTEIRDSGTGHAIGQTVYSYGTPLRALFGIAKRASLCFLVDSFGL